MSTFRVLAFTLCLGIAGCYAPGFAEEDFDCVRPGECGPAMVKVRVLLEGDGVGAVVSEPASLICEKMILEDVACRHFEAAAGTRVRLVASARAGASFKSFAGCDSTEVGAGGDGVCIFEVGAEEKTIRATFGYLLRVELEGGAELIDSVVVRTGNSAERVGADSVYENIFVESELMTVEAIAADGARVAEWIGCDAAVEATSCGLSMNARHEVKIVFADASCGDGVRIPSEACDDGNFAGADGCSANCEVEAGYVCEGAAVSVCTGFIVPASLQATENMEAQFTVRMNRAPAQRITVPISVAAPNGAEASLSTMMLEFAPDDFNETVTITPADDDVDEPEKGLVIAFGELAGDSIFAGVQVPSISVAVTDDDDAPVVTVAGDVSANEGSPVVFSIALDHPSEFPISVDYEVVGGAMPGFVFPNPNPGTVTFDRLVTAAVVTIETMQDTADEINESFRLNLREPAINATIGSQDSGSGTIFDDDATPVLSISGPSPAMVAEGAGTTSFTVSFTVTLTPASGQQVSVNWATRNGSATAGSDYDMAGGVLMFAPGQTTQTVDVTIHGDDADEIDENFYVELSSPVRALLGAVSEAPVTIVDDDLVSMTMTSYTAQEPGSGTAPAIFSVILSAPTPQTVTVDWAILAGTATPGSDYFNNSGTLIFDPGTTNQTIEVQIRADNVYENDETFSVALSNPVNASIASDPGTGTITANGPLPEIRVSSSISVTEGNAAVTAILTVTLFGATEVPASVNWSTQDFTASAPGDYTPVSNQRIDFPVGTSSQQIVVTIPPDNFDENDELFTVNLGNVSRAGIAAGNVQRNITIVDNDPLPALSIADLTVVEPATGTVNTVVTVILTPASGRTVSVDWEAVENTAVGSGSSPDFEVFPGNLSFAPGQTTRTIPVTIRSGMDPPENFFVNIYDPINATISDLQAIVTIN